MNQSKTTYLVFALLGVVILIMLVQVVKFSSPNPRPSENTTAPVTQSTPAPAFHINSTNITSQPMAVNEPITITFDRPVNNEKLALQITPKEKVVPLFNSDLTMLTIKPLNTWSFDTRYSIKVLKSTESQDNQFLDKDYEFAFQTKSFVGI